MASQIFFGPTYEWNFPEFGFVSKKSECGRLQKPNKIVGGTLSSSLVCGPCERPEHNADFCPYFSSQQARFELGRFNVVETEVEVLATHIEGRVQTRIWPDQSGADQYSTEIVVNAIGGQLIGISEGAHDG